MENLSPDTKIADLTVGQFEEVMTRVLCRAAEFLAVRMAQDLSYFRNLQLEDDHANALNAKRVDAVTAVREKIAGEDWPEFGLRKSS